MVSWVGMMVVMVAGHCTGHLQLLNLPRVGRESYWELLLATTGPFVLRRAMGILTSARCIELLDLREAGRLGTLRQYHDLCQLLPQVGYFKVVCIALTTIRVLSLLFDLIYVF